MSDEHIHIAFDQDVTLHDEEDGVGLAAASLCISNGAVELEGTLSSKVWQAVVARAGLGLIPEAMPHGGPESIDAERPVAVRLHLRDGLPTGLQLQDVAGHLAQGAGEGADAQAWVLCEALQDVALPEGVEGTGQAGFRTTWAQAEEPLGELAEVTVEWLAAAGAEVDIIEPELMRVPMEDEGLQWIMLVRIDEATRIVAFYSVFPRLIPEEARHDAALFLVGQTFEMHFGSFEMDPDDGEVRLRTAWAGGPDEVPSDGQIYGLVAPHAPLMTALVAAMDQLVTEAGEA